MKPKTDAVSPYPAVQKLIIDLPITIEECEVIAAPPRIGRDQLFASRQAQCFDLRIGVAPTTRRRFHADNFGRQVFGGRWSGDDKQFLMLVKNQTERHVASLAVKSLITITS